MEGPHDFDEIWRADGPTLWRAVYAFTGGRRDVTDDAVAEAFARAMARGGKVRDPLAYLFRIAFRVAGAELARRNKEVQDVPEVSLPDPTANRPASWKQDGLDWQRIGGRTFVYMENGQNGVLLGPMPDCGPGEVQDAAANVRAPVLDCPDGTKGGWTIDGQPLTGNSPDLAHGVPASHVVCAWDGTLISPVVPLP